jgi:hypothetical protein
MRWLIHGPLTTAVAEALKRHGHTTQTPAEVELSDGASAREVFDSAHKKQLDVITADGKLVNDLYESPVRFGRSLVFLQLEGGAVEQDDAVDRLFTRYKRLSPGRLYTVTETRVKIRQLPTSGRSSED